MRRLERRKEVRFRGFYASLNLNLLDIEDGVLGVHGRLILRRLANQTLLIGERHERGSCVATLFIGN